MAVNITVDTSALQRGMIRGLEIQYGGHVNGTHVATRLMLGRRLALLEMGVVTFNQVVSSLREHVSFLAYELGNIPQSSLAVDRVKRSLLRNELDLVNNCIRDVLAVSTLGDTQVHL